MEISSLNSERPESYDIILVLVIYLHIRPVSLATVAVPSLTTDTSYPEASQDTAGPTSSNLFHLNAQNSLKTAWFYPLCFLSLVSQTAKE